MGVRVLEFHADWCGPCNQQDAILGNVMDEWEDNNSVFFDNKVDVDENSAIATKYNIRSMPTIVILVANEDDGKTRETERFMGVTEEDDINSAISSALSVE